jgi:glycolate oxidase FAD binding subunit
VPPSEGARAAAIILERLPGEALLDWGGGLVWLALSPVDDAGETVVRGTVKMTGGHATLIRADSTVRSRIAPFQPQPAALAALTRRVKEGFDPARILNPGRMYAEL